MTWIHASRVHRMPVLDEEEERPASRSVKPLTVGRASDPAEASADRFADIVMRAMSSPLPGPLREERATVSGRVRNGGLTGHRECTEPGQSEPRVRRMSGASTDRLGGVALDAQTEERIQAAREGGRGLPSTIRRVAERASGVGLGHVRVHTGAEPDRLSRSMDAAAFTVGSDVYLSRSVGDPGAATSAPVIAHELGHVVDGSEPNQVRRLFGKSMKGLPVVGSSGRTERANGLSKQDKAEQKAGYARGAAQRKDLQAAIAPLESALAKIRKSHTPGNRATYDAAYLLRDKAQRLLDLMPGPSTRGAQKVMGVAYPEERKRLRYIVSEAQLIWDEHLVRMTKQKAGNIYEAAGRTAGAAGGSGLQKLTPGARSEAFGGAPPPAVPAAAPAGLFDDAPAVDEQPGARQHAAGKALGLSAAETAAIMTFTSEDYKYINPATANSESWMRSSNRALIDADKLTDTEKAELEASFDRVSAAQQRADRKKELAQLKEEGSLHAGMAMQALSKLPVWKGKLYRGEALLQEDFDRRFTTVAKDLERGGPLPKTFGVREKISKRQAISSASKGRDVATDFASREAAKLWGKAIKHRRVVWEMDVTNGRDIEALSVKGIEREVALLPGAEFKITSVRFEDSTVRGREKEWGVVVVKCVQVK